MKAILVDDESLAIEYLEKQIMKHSNIEIIDTFTSFDIEANNTLLTEIDIVFLDIEMPQISGLELAELMLEINPKLEIVFVTAFNQYAVQAFELNALDYLLKPIQSERMKKTIARINKGEDDLVRISGEPDGKMHVSVCGDLTFEAIPGVLTPVQWRTTKAKELFLYLLHNNDKIVQKAKLVELLWPDFEHDKAFSQLYTAIYHIRKVLEQFGEHFSLRSLQEGYNLAIDKVSIDIVEWEQHITTLPEIDEQVIDDYEKAMKLYTGAYLGDNDYTWTVAESFRLEKLWSKVAHEIADYYQETGDSENAETWFVNITLTKPEDEQAHFSLMEIYGSLGLGLLVDHQYTQLQKAANDLSIQISAHIQNWYKIWKSSH